MSMLPSPERAPTKTGRPAHDLGAPGATEMGRATRDSIWCRRTLATIMTRERAWRAASAARHTAQNNTHANTTGVPEECVW